MMVKGCCFLLTNVDDRTDSIVPAYAAELLSIHRFTIENARAITYFNLKPPIKTRYSPGIL